MAVKGRIYPNIEEGAPREMEPMHVKGGRRDGKAASFELERRWRGVWDRLDLNSDGRISVRVLGDRIANHPSTARLMPEETREQMLQFADANRDGHIDYAEFLTVIKAGDTSAELSGFRKLLALTAYTELPKSERPKAVKSYLERYNCYPPPLFMLFISIIEIVVFVYYGIVMGRIEMNGPVASGSPLIYNPKRRYEIWRYLSYMLIHVGWFHLAMNLFVQLAVGLPLELVHKLWRVMLVYFAGVLAGTLGTSIADPSVFLAGASGGVYALMAAHLANVIINWREMELAAVRLVFWLVIASIDFGSAVYYRYIAQDKRYEKIGYAAHLSGAIVGVLVGIVVLRNFRKLVWERVIWWIALVAVVLLFGYALVFNLTYDGFPNADTRPLRWPLQRDERRG